MYCRNCSNEVNEGSVVCVKCGYDPMSETNYCYNCGNETSEKQIICIKCGVKLSNSPVKAAQKKSQKSSEYSGLYRSSDEKVIFGVCGGVSHKLGMQPIILRVVAFLFFAFFAFFYLLGLLLPSYPTKDV